jgi:hypothetical protein
VVFLSPLVCSNGSFCSPGKFPVVVSVLLAVGAMEFGYLCFCCCFFFFFFTDTFRLSRLGSDLRSCSSRFLFSQIYVDTPEIL